MNEHHASHRSRRGFFYLGLLSAALFGLACLYGLSYFIAERMAWQNALSDLTAADRVRFKNWAFSPVSVPVEWETVPPLLPAEMVEEKEDLKATLLEKGHILRVKTGSGNQLLEIALLTGGKISAADWEVVTSFTVAFKPVIEEALELVKQPEYRFNTRGNPGPNVKRSGWSLSSTYLCDYALAMSRNGNHEDSLKAMEALLRLQRQDSDAAYIDHTLALIMCTKALNTLERIERQTTETGVRQAYASLLHERESDVKNGPPELLFNEGYQLYRQMRADGYSRKPTVSPYDLYFMTVHRDEYYGWLLKNLPQDDKRKVYALDALDRFNADYGNGRFNKVLEKLDNSPFSPLAQPFITLNHYPDLVMVWKALAEQVDERKQVNARYDKTRLTFEKIN